MFNQKTMTMFPQNCNLLVKVLSYLDEDNLEEESEQEIERKQKIYEILRTSMNFQDVLDTYDDENDYIPVPYKEAIQSQQSTQKSQQSQHLKSPMQTFTQHFKNKGQQGRLFTLTDETEQTVDDRKPKHVRGPSKIQEILQDLQANVADDIMKMANDIIKFTENSQNTNESAKFIPSDKKSNPPLSEKKNVQPTVNNECFKIFNKQKSQQQLLTHHQQNNSENLYNRQSGSCKSKVNSQPNVTNYNSNNTNYNSNYNTNQSISKPQQNTQLNYHSKSNSSQLSNHKNQPEQQQLFSNPLKSFSSVKKSNQSNCDSIFSIKSKEHYIDEFENDCHDNFDNFQQNENNQPNSYNELYNGFDCFDSKGYEDTENNKDQPTSMNISKRLEKDNVSTHSNSGLKNQGSDQKSYQDFSEPCQKTQESEKKEQQQQNVSTQKKKVKRRKKSRIPKNIKYFLDIIEEQSNDQYTPDKSLLESTEELDTIQSVPNFGESAHFEVDYRSDRKHLTISEGNKMPFRMPGTNEMINDMQSSDSYDHPNSTMANQTLVNFEDIDQILNQVQGYKTLRQKNYEEEAILASWSRVCNEIIRKNLLPVTLDLERIQNQLEYQQQNSHCQKRFHLNRKTTMRTEQNSFIENSCVIGMDNQQIEKSQTDIQIDENEEITLLNKQFSPNFSDVCKRIQFAGDEQKILQGRKTSKQPDEQNQLYEYDQQHLNFQF